MHHLLKSIGFILTVTFLLPSLSGQDIQCTLLVDRQCGDFEMPTVYCSESCDDPVANEIPQCPVGAYADRVNGYAGISGESPAGIGEVGYTNFEETAVPCLERAPCSGGCLSTTIVLWDPPVGEEIAVDFYECIIPLAFGEFDPYSPVRTYYLLEPVGESCNGDAAGQPAGDDTPADDGPMIG